MHASGSAASRKPSSCRSSQKITKYQAHVNNQARMAELTARCFDCAMLERGPTQLNIPRDYFYGEYRLR